VAKQSLHLLIQSIAGAFAEAQEQIQRLQVSTVRQYFDEDNRPVSVDVRLPSTSPDASVGEERLVRVALLSLVGPRLLTVKDMEISFEVGLSADAACADNDGAAGSASTVLAAEGTLAWATSTYRPLNVDLGVRRNGEGAPLAHVTLRVETQPCSEGMARLVQNMDQLI
jgi:hypothetical protein